MLNTLVWLQSTGSVNTALSPKGDENGREPGCVANISTHERRKRLLGGVIQFAISLAILAALIALGTDRLWRLPLFFLFWGAASGFFNGAIKLEWLLPREVRASWARMWKK
jgi:hypothetical protein